MLLTTSRFLKSSDRFKYDGKYERLILIPFKMMCPLSYWRNLVPYQHIKDVDYERINKHYDDFAFCRQLGIYTINFLDDCPYMDKKEYHKWVLIWRWHYQELSETIRFLKRHRKNELKENLTYKSHYQIYNLKCLANKMLLARERYKILRKSFKEGKQTA